MPRRQNGPHTDATGVALIEALVAAALLASALVALAGLLAAAASSTHRAHIVSTSAILASRKMEQLRSLAWSMDAAGAAISDVSSDTAVEDGEIECSRVGQSAGTGLSASPPGTLDADVAGYVDYVDGHGCGLGGGDRPPPGTLYVRRWSVTPHPAAPGSALVLQVVVLRYDPAMIDDHAPRRRPEAARLVSIKARKRL